jgi:hypothetical protein
MNAALNLDTLDPIALTKCCTKCHCRLPAEQFRMRTHKIKPYRDSVCHQCNVDYRRALRQAQRAGKPPTVRVVHIFGRHPEDAACDAAFMGWREADNVFQGARV